MLNDSTSVFGKLIVQLGTRFAPPLARDNPARREDGQLSGGK
jgi:hypothetical protein